VVKTKLLKVKKWIDANEAAMRLSLSLEDKVTALDLLELALENEITLSVKFPRGNSFVIREVKQLTQPYLERLEKVFHFELVSSCIDRKALPAKGSEEYDSLFKKFIQQYCAKNNLSANEISNDGKPSIHNLTYEYFEYSQNLQHMDTVIYELPMIGAETIDIEALIEINNERKPPEAIHLDGVFLRTPDGRLFNLMDKFSKEDLAQFPRAKNEDEESNYLNRREYFPAGGLPIGCEIGISPENLLIFEQNLSEENLDEELSQKALLLLGAVINEVTGSTIKWTQGKLATAIEEKKIKGLKERTINGIFANANKAFKSIN